MSVLDADPDARKAAKTVTVKVFGHGAASAPETTGGTPFRPVEFDGLTVTSYLDERSNRVAYSFRARVLPTSHQQ
ncbi:MAG: hypothetical protein ACR2FQ_05995 [Pseudonocardiaceae bacterium]